VLILLFLDGTLEQAKLEEDLDCVVGTEANNSVGRSHYVMIFSRLITALLQVCFPTFMELLLGLGLGKMVKLGCNSEFKLLVIKEPLLTFDFGCVTTSENKLGLQEF